MFLCRLPLQEIHIGIALSSVVCCCCCCLLWKQVNIIWLYPSHALIDFNKRWWFVDEVKGHIKVKGHLKSSCKIGWKCENGLIWKVEVQLEPNLVYWYNMLTIWCSCCQRSHTKVKGHLRPSCETGHKKGSKVKMCHFRILKMLLLLQII